MLGAGGDALERRIRKLEKERIAEPAIMMVRLRELFSQSVRTVPPRMLEEFFLQLVESYSGEKFDKEAFYDRLYAAADLFSCDYDDRDSVLSFEEWKLVGELVSDYGVDIDDDTLTYIMSRVVDHGAL
jgi:hypothetical protein